MPKNDKREQKIRTNIKNVSITEFEFLIKQYGEIVGHGSHPKAIINGRTFPYVKENPVNFNYVKRILEIIDEMKEVG
jgi:hypothetical protein